MRAPHPALRELYRQASGAPAFAARLGRADAACAAVAQAIDLGPLDGERAVAALLAGSAVDSRLTPSLARLDAMVEGDGGAGAGSPSGRRHALPAEPAMATPARPAAAFDPEAHPRIAAWRANVAPGRDATGGGQAEPANPVPHPRIAARRLPAAPPGVPPAATGRGPAAAVPVAYAPGIRRVDAAAARSALAAIAARSGAGSAHERVVATLDGQAPDPSASTTAPPSPTGPLTPQSAAQIDRALTRLASRPGPPRPAALPRAFSTAPPAGLGAPVAANAPLPAGQERRARPDADMPAPPSVPAALPVAVGPGPTATAGLTGLRRLAALARPAAAPAASPQAATAGDEARPAPPLPARPAAPPVPLAEEMAAILRREAERDGIDLIGGVP